MSRLVLLIVALGLGFQLACSTSAPPKTIAGRYVHIHGPLRSFLELKPDKTISFYRQEVGAAPRSDGFEYKPSTGTYSEEGPVVKVHLQGGTMYEYDGQFDRDWQFKKDSGALIQQPDGTHFVLETEEMKSNDLTTAKLSPELPLDKARLAIDEWVVSQLDSFQETILQRKLKPNEKIRNGANTIVYVLEGTPIEVDGWRHIARVRIMFNKIPVESTQPPPPNLSVEQQMEFQSRVKMPKTVSLHSGPGVATFYHDNDGKWFLIGLGRIFPDNPFPPDYTEWQTHSVEVKQ
jgi:hypothetical protein